MTQAPGHPFDTRVPPQAIEVESAVLGAMMTDAQAVADVREILLPEHFYGPANRKIYKAMLALASRNEPVDLATVRAELEREGLLEKIGGPGVLIDIADSVLSAAYAPAHARLVLEKATLRRMIALCNDTIQECHNGAGPVAGLLERIDTRITDIRVSASVSSQGGLVTVNMGTVEAEPIDWLWYPFIPCATVTIIQGKPGIGKSWITLVIAAIVSQGYKFPEVSGQPNTLREPANVLLMADEDLLSKIIKPRLVLAQANTNRVIAIRGVQLRGGKPGEEGEILLSDIEGIEGEIIKNNAVLLIVDPIQAFVASTVDMRRQNEMRSITKRIGRMAERTGCSVIMVQHERKAGGSPDNRGMDSKDIYAQCRSALMVAPNPDDPKPFDPSTFIMVQSKHSMTPPGEARAIGYRLSKLDGFMWTGPTDTPIERLIEEYKPEKSRLGASTSDAVEFLSDFLADGARSATEIQAQARRDGISHAKLAEAKTQLGLQYFRQWGRYFWRLPETVKEGEFGPPIVCDDPENATQTA